jgi:uncharacterized Zn finger protein (UPF0148 family)
VKLLKKMLVESGGGAALASESCKNNHSEFAKKGWAFCPHCGKRIEIVQVCSACGRSFTSEKSFQYHKMAWHMKPDKCPSCGSKSNLRREVARATAAGTMKEVNIWHCRKCNARFRWYKSSLRTKVISSDRSDLAGLVHFLNPRVT